MVSFSCEVCNDTIIKKKLDQHTQRCHGAYFSCIDCSVTFQGTAYRNHTSCITEAEKYEKALYKGPKKKQQQPPKQEQPKEPVKEQPKEEKKEKKEKKDKKTKKESDSLDKYFKSTKEQNLYKVIKKAAQDKDQDIKDYLKSLKVVKGEDGKVSFVF